MQYATRVEDEKLARNMCALLAAARQAVKHWYEFGPEYGMDEAIHILDTCLKRLQGDTNG